MSDLVVMAKNAEEMRLAQANLSSWVGMKLESSRHEFGEMSENLDIAKKSKWRTSGLVNAVLGARKRMEFYEKIKAAVDAGYVIVPDFPIDIFAVRTERDYPLKQYSTHWATDRTQQSESPPLGAGNYVDDQPITRSKDIVRYNPSSGKEEMAVAYTSAEFKDVDFPIKAVRPVILDETSKALKLKIFDEVGIIGAGKRRQLVRGTPTGADPMIIGRIIFKHGAKSKRVNFLLAWWLNPSDLTV